MEFEKLGGKKYDHTLKWMAETEAQGFFEWLMALLGRAGYVLQEISVSKELAPAARYIDLVWRILTPRGTVALLHIELQLDPDDTMGQRMLEYAMRLYERDHLPILSVVIWLKRTSHMLPVPPFIVYLDDEEWFRYPYAAIRLWEVPQAEILERPYPVLWPLAGLMAGTNADSVASIGKQIAEQQDVQRPLKEELIGYLGLLAGVQLNKDEVRAALRRHPMVEELLKHSSFAQALKEEGREEGREEGLTAGRIEEARRMAQVGLEKRFGTLSDDVLAAIQAADEATLENVVGARTLEEARAHLGLS